jgi:hypothetical protein
MRHSDDPIRLGITGTRQGMTEYQFSELTEFLRAFPSDTEFHHGDCVGVDVEAAALARSMGMLIVCHPPNNPSNRGFYGGDEMRTPRSYLERNRNIVLSSDVLLVVPAESQQQPRGGTWYTYNFAGKCAVPRVLFLPERSG